MLAYSIYKPASSASFEFIAQCGYIGLNNAVIPDSLQIFENSLTNSLRYFKNFSKSS
jgi:hypothetical protein